jgi:hypothetical protein
MHPLNLQGNWALTVAVILGIILGFILVKSSLAEDKVKALLDFNDTYLFECFLFTIAFGILFYHWGRHFNIVPLQTAHFQFWKTMLGATFFGVGASLCRQVPATAIVAMASGKLYNLWIIAGMIIAIPLIKILYPYTYGPLSSYENPVPCYENMNHYFSEQCGVSTWAAGIMFCLAIFLLFTTSQGKTKS